MSVKLLTEHQLEFLTLTQGYTGWYESTLVIMPHFWKSHVMAQICFDFLFLEYCVYYHSYLVEMEHLLSMANSANTDTETLHSAAFILIHTVEKI